MHVMIAWGKLRLGTWDQSTRRVVSTTITVKGLRARQLLRSTEDPDEGMSVSMWESQADLINYERSELRESLAKEAEHLYRGEFWVKHFEIIDSSG